MMTPELAVCLLALLLYGLPVAMGGLVCIIVDREYHRALVAEIAYWQAQPVPAPVPWDLLNEGDRDAA